MPVAEAAAARETIIIDVPVDMREYMTRLLERHWHVDSFAEGQAALDAILADPPAVVVTDVMMPRLDGFALLEALRADRRTATVPVIVVSAHAGEESSIEGLDAGADDYLVKPFSARALVARVRVNLELARLRREAGRLSALEGVRSRVITTVSHELRTPVSAIYGAARTLDCPEAHRREDAPRAAHGDRQRLARITNDILTTEALAAGVITLERERVDLRAEAASAVEAARARPGSSVSLRADLPDDAATVEGDRTRLQQVLANLIDNAIKYSPDGGEVEVSLDRVDGRVEVTVADSGLGIPEGSREQVFERFYRVDPQLTGGVGGSGLGLYISRQIVESLGGAIRHEPNEPSGSRFVVSLPAE